MLSNCQDTLYNKTSPPLHNICKVLLNVESIGELIQRRLKDLGMSKAALAQKVGVSRTYIGDLANGTAKTKSGFYRPNPEIVAGLASALKVTESEILNALGYGSIEESEDELTAEIMKDLRISLQGGGKGLTQKQKQEIVDLAVTIARGVIAKGDTESGKTEDH